MPEPKANGPSALKKRRGHQSLAGRRAYTPLAYHRSNALTMRGNHSRNRLTLEEQRQIRRAYGDFLQRYDWTHFCTFTSDNPFLKTQALTGYFEKTFIPRLENRIERPVSWFWVTEWSPGIGRLHLHALLAADGANEAHVVREWNKGNAKVERFDPARGASYYVSKHITQEETEIGLSDTLPPITQAPNPFRQD